MSCADNVVLRSRRIIGMTVEQRGRLHVIGIPDRKREARKEILRVLLMVLFAFGCCPLGLFEADGRLAACQAGIHSYTLLALTCFRWHSRIEIIVHNEPPFSSASRPRESKSICRRRVVFTPRWSMKTSRYGTPSSCL